MNGSDAKENQRSWMVHGQVLQSIALQFFKEVSRLRTTVMSNHNFWASPVNRGSPFKATLSVDLPSNLQEVKHETDGKKQDEETESPKMCLDFESESLSPLLNIDLNPNPPDVSPFCIDLSTEDESDLEILSELEASDETSRFKDDLSMVLSTSQSKKFSDPPLLNKIARFLILESLDFFEPSPYDEIISANSMPSLNFDALNNLSNGSFSFQTPKKLEEMEDEPTFEEKNIEGKEEEIYFIPSTELTKGFRMSISKTSKAFSRILVELYETLCTIGFKYKQHSPEVFEEILKNHQKAKMMESLNSNQETSVTAVSPFVFDLNTHENPGFNSLFDERDIGENDGYTEGRKLSRFSAMEQNPCNLVRITAIPQAPRANSITPHTYQPFAHVKENYSYAIDQVPSTFYPRKGVQRGISNNFLGLERRFTQPTPPKRPQARFYGPNQKFFDGSVDAKKGFRNGRDLRKPGLNNVLNSDLNNRTIKNASNNRNGSNSKNYKPSRIFLRQTQPKLPPLYCSKYRELTEQIPKAPFDPAPPVNPRVLGRSQQVNGGNAEDLQSRCRYPLQRCKSSNTIYMNPIRGKSYKIPFSTDERTTQKEGEGYILASEANRQQQKSNVPVPPSRNLKQYTFGTNIETPYRRWTSQGLKSSGKAKSFSAKSNTGKLAHAIKRPKKVGITIKHPRDESGKKGALVCYAGNSRISEGFPKNTKNGASFYGQKARTLEGIENLPKESPEKNREQTMLSSFIEQQRAGLNFAYFRNGGAGEVNNEQIEGKDEYVGEFCRGSITPLIPSDSMTDELPPKVPSQSVFPATRIKSIQDSGSAANPEVSLRGVNKIVPRHLPIAPWGNNLPNAPETVHKPSYEIQTSERAENPFFVYKTPGMYTSLDKDPPKPPPMAFPKNTSSLPTYRNEFVAPQRVRRYAESLRYSAAKAAAAFSMRQKTATKSGIPPPPPLSMHPAWRQGRTGSVLAN